MKKKWIKFIVILIIVLALIPLGVAYFLRFEVTGVDKSNEWIGFWGGYLGAIIGGVITLLVMHLSLKDGRRNLYQQMDFEKRKSEFERKTYFNDELLIQLIEYQTAIEGYICYLSNLVDKKPVEENFGGIAQAEKISTLSKIIAIKLESKKKNSEYKYVNELLDSVCIIAEEITEGISRAKSATNMLGETKELLSVLKVRKDSLLENVEKYYITNEGKEETIDNEETVCERIRILKKEKMRKEFDITVMTGFLLPLIYLIYSLLPKDPQHKPIIVIIVSVIMAIIYLLIACDKHERCIQCELEINELERQYDKE